MNKYEEEKKSLEKLATSQQMAASNPNASVWVEASAGTGKTKVLSDRVLKLLLKNVNPSKILCLTYTKAAAVEMNERIAKRLSNWAIESDEELDGELEKLLGNDFFVSKNEMQKKARTLFAQILDAPGGMKIQTIHSFCQDILKRFPLEANISPYFEVLDDRNSKEILQNIQSDLLKTANTDEDIYLRDSILFLVNSVSEFKFPEIMNTITANRNKIDILLKKYSSTKDIINALEEKLGISSCLTEEDVIGKIFSTIDKDEFKRCMSAFFKGGKEDNKRANTFAVISENNFDIQYYEEYKNIFLTQNGSKRANLARKDAIKDYPQILEFMNAECERIYNIENKLKTIKVLRSTIAVVYISKKIIDAYNKYKEMFSVLDYEDLIIKTRQLLEDRETADWVLFKLDGGIEHILIDEAQDTSPNQWAIVRAISEEFFAGIGVHDSELKRSIFVVGDRKQSIYSFQGADPKEFDKMFDYFKQKSESFLKIHLDVSFRSTKAIMDCVNLLFDTEEAKKGVVPCDEKINHCPFRLGDGGLVEIAPLSQNNDCEDVKYNWNIPLERIQKSSPSNLLAKQIARNIKDMVENKEILASKNRPIKYGDFMFLVQRRNSFVEEFVRACKEIGVNVAGVDKLQLLEQIAVQDLISLGKFLLLPQDDLSLAEVLKSPIFGLDDNDLFDLCHNRNTSLFNSISHNEEYTEIATWLKTLLNMSGFNRPLELFSFVLINMGARKNFISRMGNDVEDVLDEFLNLTLNFEQNNTPTLQNFINWIIKDDVVVKKETEQGDSNTVKIMTVHGSKGLQAPIVILADTVRVKNKAKNASFLWDDDLFYFPLSSESYNDKCNNLNSVICDGNLDEYRRLLYVALTRAEDRLYVSGYTKDKNIKDESWYGLLKNNIVSNIKEASATDKIIYQIEQENTFDEEQKQISLVNQTTKDYSFLLDKPSVESPLAKPFTPSVDSDANDEVISSPLEDNGIFYRRGTAIHRLLQYISTVSEDERFEASMCFLEKELNDFSIDERHNITEEVIMLCNKYEDLFSTSSMSEVPIIGEIDGKIISSKVDRLVIKDDVVMIVDYKTNRPAAKKIEDVPQLYIKQVGTYKRLLENIYPNKIVETYLLWTNTCNMMKI
ncbi:MAG: double-strand break repair helicase AddA [Alphaproteobacteria bacterium]|nr:double-strand break repair helicase AddA [Alphaproteobacteria bacterium]